MKLKNILFFKSFFIFFCFIFLPNNNLFSEGIKYSRAIVTTPSGVQINVEVADTISKRRLGLGKRTSLKKNWGMLFVFEEMDRHSFWMKDMNFSLDIIWLNNFRIVHIEENVNPPIIKQESQIFKPSPLANFVLEIAAGRANELKLNKGDLLSYKFF